MSTYNIVAPTGQKFGSAESFGEANETMVALTLQWGTQFRVVPVGEGDTAFMRERQVVARRAADFLMLQRDYPDSDAAKMAMAGLISAKKKLDKLLSIRDTMQKGSAE